MSLKSDRPAKGNSVAGAQATQQEFRQRLDRFNTLVRSPLHTALGTAELLKDTKLDVSQLALVNAFIQATESVLTELQTLFQQPAGNYLPEGRADSGGQELDLSAYVVLAQDATSCKQQWELTI
jgi:hypothetical protein